MNEPSDDLERLRTELLARIEAATSEAEISDAVNELIDSDTPSLRGVISKARNGATLTLGAAQLSAAGPAGTAHLELGASASIAATAHITATALVTGGQVPPVTGDITLKVPDPKRPVLTVNQGIAFVVLVSALQPYIAGLHGDGRTLAATHAIAVAVALVLLLGQRFDDRP
jgi:hypothetical protein